MLLFVSTQPAPETLTLTAHRTYIFKEEEPPIPLRPQKELFSSSSLVASESLRPRSTETARQKLPLTLSFREISVHRGRESTGVRTVGGDPSPHRELGNRVLLAINKNQAITVKHPPPGTCLNQLGPTF